MSETTQPPVVLITGALSDIGQATARALASAGYAVVLSCRRPEAAQPFRATLLHECKAPEVSVVKADVRDRAQVQAMYEQAYQAFGRVDALVNHAGINRDGPFLQMTDEDWDTVLATVLYGTFACSQEFARRYTGTDGNIVNIGAITAVKGRKNGANYCSARAAVLALTKCMALELAPRIRVNTVTPGRIDTDELRTRYHLEDVQKRTVLEQEVPLQRLGKPEEVAGLIAFLVTSGQYITGQNFFVDGGLYMR